MARVKRGVTTRAKHKRTLEQAKGYYGRRRLRDAESVRRPVPGDPCPFDSLLAKPAPCPYRRPAFQIVGKTNGPAS